MNINLLPLSMKNYMYGLKKILIWSIIIAFIIWVTLAIFMLFYMDTATIFAVSSLFLLFILICIFPFFLHYKTSQSTVQMDSTKISILDHKGICWREIRYENISNFRVETITGFFYGVNQERCHNDFICLFLNGNNSIPYASFSKLFYHKDFCMIAYDPAALEWIRARMADKGD